VERQPNVGVQGWIGSRSVDWQVDRHLCWHDPNLIAFAWAGYICNTRELVVLNAVCNLQESLYDCWLLATSRWPD
jgi:hypothetical protein